MKLILQFVALISLLLFVLSRRGTAQKVTKKVKKVQCFFTRGSRTPAEFSGQRTFLIRHNCSLTILIITFSAIQVMAQEDSLTSVELEGLTIYGEIPEKYVAGSKIQKMDSAVLAQLNSSSLADLLLQQSPVYVKQYGNGMLSSVSFRGTSAAHTAVLWHGINLNALTTGETDFATIPLFIFDQVELQYGAASSLYGSDAIGGSIHIGDQKKVEAPFSMDLQQDIGSFGQFFSGVKSSYRTGKFSGTTKLYRYVAENDFPFENFTQAGNPEQRQKNAGVLYQGVLQNLQYQWKPERQLSASVWYHHHDREVQPSMVNMDEENVQEDQSLRMATHFTEASRIGHFDAMLGLVYDDLLYNAMDRTTSTRYISSIKYEYDFNDRLSIRAGADWNYIVAASDYYENKLTEHRNDLFVSLRYEPLPFWTASFNARQAFVSGFNAPFAPSLGNEFTLLNDTRQQLTLKALLSRSYRVPTLNNRYWTPGGNPDLLPEEGMSIEGGIVYNYHAERFKAKLEATYYQMWVDDWIIWLPVGNGSVWSPENIRKVNSQGVELMGRGTTKFGNIHLTLGGNYAYTRSVNHEGLNEFDQSIGKQLPYVPFHRGTIYLYADYRQWHGQVNTHYTGYRYTSTDNENFLEGFTLVNTSLERKIKLGKSIASISFQVRNLFDVKYQNLSLRAMPGRRYHFSLRYHFSTQSQP